MSKGILSSSLGCAVHRSALAVLLAFVVVPTTLASPPSSGKPVHLTCDSLSNPLGMDDPSPLFSWQLQDSRSGARQSAYQLQVASDPESLAAGKADIWDSGRVASEQSVGVAYGGSALLAEKRYFWRVLLWNQDSQPYPASDVAWFETGVLRPENWRAKWIGSESVEHRLLRESKAEWISNQSDASYKPSSESHHDFLFSFELQKTVKHASLYVTGQDTAAAWLNGKQVITAQPLPPSKKSPWQTYARADVTAQLRSGKNSLAVEIIRYHSPDSGTKSDESRTPMSACLIVEMQDGTFAVFPSDGRWKSALNTSAGWTAAGFDDSGWTAAGTYVFTGSPMDDAALGMPLPTDSVKILRRGFCVSKPVKSARLYVTALGGYEFHLNGRRVGDQVLSPGWTDYRLRVPYQGLRRDAAGQRRQKCAGRLPRPGLVHYSADVGRQRLQLWQHAARSSRATPYRAFRRFGGMDQHRPNLEGRCFRPSPSSRNLRRRNLRRPPRATRLGHRSIRRYDVADAAKPRCSPRAATIVEPIFPANPGRDGPHGKGHHESFARGL